MVLHINDLESKRELHRVSSYLYLRSYFCLQSWIGELKLSLALLVNGISTFWDLFTSEFFKLLSGDMKSLKKLFTFFLFANNFFRVGVGAFGLLNVLREMEGLVQLFDSRVFHFCRSDKRIDF